MADSFKTLAKKAGMTAAKFAAANVHTDSPVGKMARLWYSMSGTHGMGRARMDGSGDKRTAAHKLYQIG